MKFFCFEGEYILWRRNNNKMKKCKLLVRIFVGKFVNIIILRKEVYLKIGEFKFMELVKMTMNYGLRF